ncbi:haloalkane dehalogenase [Dactylosporangium vinaceum]|uniref:haloalkane dehalogenase n=1 Tax=Dactylosporangium vinaceum TaxID=53362 RepID=UPI001CA86791|nr:haloalkane dehalogenase [Dactylosporangium vinaceum]UAB94262.1 haloalkane dehalogenase [Dactylosporangium vinaceum]
MEVLGSHMHYLDTGGDGPPVVFLHGNPTSSRLWAKTLEHADLGGRRAIAPDLIGMGRSGRPDLEYRLADHVEYVDAFLDALGLRRLVLVGHDWGVAIGMELLRRRPDGVRGFAFMEGHLRPLESWGEFDEGGREVFRRLRTRDEGERMVLDDNWLITQVAPDYAEFYPDARSRRPLLQWTREIPIAGEPGDTAALMAAGWAHLRRSPVPKLLVHAAPGVVVTPAKVEQCRAELPALTTVRIDAPGHFLPAEAPEALAAALSAWLRTFDE